MVAPGFEKIFELHLKEVKKIDRAEAHGTLSFVCADPDVQGSLEKAGLKVLDKNLNTSISPRKPGER